MGVITSSKFFCLGLLLVASTAAGAIPALADTEDNVQRGLNDCRAVLIEEGYDAGRCIGMAAGIGMVLAMNCFSRDDGYMPQFAAEPYPSNGAAIQAFINWAEKNPQHWGKRFSIGMMIALSETYPCKR